MTQAQKLFNRQSLRLHRQRAALHHQKRGFLFDHIADEMRARLSDVKRQFDLALNIGWHGYQPLAQANQVKQWLQSDISENMMKTCSVPIFVADEEALPLKAGSFDLITSILTLHWVNDLPSCFGQIKQALKEDGLFLAVLFAQDNLKELRLSLLQAESELKGGASMRMIPLFDIRDLGNLLQKTGFALPVVDIEKVKIHYHSMEQILDDIRMMAENQKLNASAPPLTRKLLKRAAEIYAEKFSNEDNRLIAHFRLAWLLGWAPSPSQARPAKRGSGQINLKDAIHDMRSKSLLEGK